MKAHDAITLPMERFKVLVDDERFDINAGRSDSLLGNWIMMYGRQEVPDFEEKVNYVLDRKQADLVTYVPYWEQGLELTWKSFIKDSKLPETLRLRLSYLRKEQEDAGGFARWCNLKEAAVVLGTEEGQRSKMILEKAVEEARAGGLSEKQIVYFVQEAVKTRT